MLSGLVSSVTNRSISIVCSSRFWVNSGCCGSGRIGGLGTALVSGLGDDGECEGVVMLWVSLWFEDVSECWIWVWFELFVVVVVAVAVVAGLGVLVPAPELGFGCERDRFCLSRMADSVLESVISVYVSVTTIAPNGDPGRLSIGADF